jgi:acyl carrier protein
MSVHDQALSLMAEAFGVAQESLDANLSLGGVPAWDSLGHMRLLLAIEAAIGRQMTTVEAAGIEDVAAIVRILATKQA